MAENTNINVGLTDEARAELINILSEIDALINGVKDDGSDYADADHNPFDFSDFLYDVDDDEYDEDEDEDDEKDSMEVLQDRFKAHMASSEASLNVIVLDVIEDTKLSVLKEMSDYLNTLAENNDDEVEDEYDEGYVAGISYAADELGRLHALLA